jgi:MraZ protein
MFRGNSPAKVDEKGRLKVPAHYKKLLDERYENQYFVTSEDGRFARIYPMEVWTQVEDKFNQNEMDPLRKEVQRKMNLLGDEAAMDAQGRMVLPQYLREQLKLRGDVHVIGTGKYLEVCNEEIARELLGRLFTPEERKEMTTWGI